MKSILWIGILCIGILCIRILCFGIPCFLRITNYVSSQQGMTMHMVLNN